MICRKCGNVMSDQAKFCPKCGTPVNAGAAAPGGTPAGAGRPTGSPAPAPAGTPPKPGKPQKSGKKGGFVIALAVIFVLAVIGAVLWFAKDKLMSAVGGEGSVQTEDQDSREKPDRDDEDADGGKDADDKKNADDDDADDKDADDDADDKDADDADAGRPEYNSAGEKILYDQLIWLDVSVETSSTLSESKYPAENLTDGDPSTAWVEGAEGAGEEERITFELEPGTEVYGVYVLPGMMADEEQYEEYGVPVTLIVTDREHEARIDLSSYEPDFEDPWNGALGFRLPEVFGGERDEITVMIEEAAGESEDTAISELWLYAYRTEQEDASGSGSSSGSGSTAAATAAAETTAPAATTAPEPTVVSVEISGGSYGTTATAGGYILPDSDRRYLMESDLYSLTEYQCKLARNEIYARHGRKFKDAALQEHFNSCSWYVGTVDAASFDDSVLSAIEAANRDLISAYEKKMGYNQ